MFWRSPSSGEGSFKILVVGEAVSSGIMKIGNFISILIPKFSFLFPYFNNLKLIKYWDVNLFKNIYHELNSKTTFAYACTIFINITKERERERERERE